MNYDFYNREERALCAHLFRLLHDLTPPVRDGNLFRKLLKKLGCIEPLVNPHSIRIYTEVALIRDAYFVRKPDTKKFMIELVDKAMEIQDLSECRGFAALPDILQDSSKTDPKQIRKKAEDLSIAMTCQENILYGFVQAVFNAKPDFAIVYDNTLVVVEAKYTQHFTSKQLRRTRQIGEVWRDLLYNDLGFNSKPSLFVSKLGAANSGAELTWEWVAELSSKVYNETDRSLIAFRNAVKFLTDN